jgi:G6PDH family F420-dependent oxidoreductase
MTQLGLALTSEQLEPDEVVDRARRAEEAGFDYVTVSDHFHPWVEAQGESPFVWTTLGGIARETESLEVGTAVTCPILRIHPVNVAQAAATTAAAFDGRFFLGVGTGENLNEHVVGRHWPDHGVRLEMLEEAVDVMQTLWSGGMHTYHGEYYTVQNARLFTLPEDPPAVYVAAGGPKSAAAAGAFGDGLVSTAPKAKLVDRFHSAATGPRYGQFTACYAGNETTATDIAYENWSFSVLSGELSSELALPRHFEQASRLVDPEDMDELVLGSDPEAYLEAIEKYAEAGFDHVAINQVNPDADDFFEMAESELVPAVD